MSSSLMFCPGLPSMAAAGLAHGAPGGQLDLGSMRGASFAGGRSKYTSLGVLPSRYSCGRCSLYQSRWQASSLRMSSRRNRRMTRRVHSSLRVRMKRSITAMLPYLPTAPNRGRIPLRLHHALNPSHQNCEPSSQMMYFGLALACRRPRKVRIWMAATSGL